MYVQHLLHVGKREDPRDEVEFSHAIRETVARLVMDRPIHTTQRKRGYGSGTVVFEIEEQWWIS